MTSDRDPYHVLGVPAGATLEQITAAYRRLARRHHPDVSTVTGAEQRMAEINAAWTLLRDPHKRHAWDLSHGVARHHAVHASPSESTTGIPWPTPGSYQRSTAWRRGPGGEGAAGPPPGNPRGSVLPFGRHIGWSLGEIARVDPGYLAWLESRHEGAPYRAEIRELLASTRPGGGDSAPVARRRSIFG